MAIPACTHHVWFVSGIQGVIAGFTRCRVCDAVASRIDESNYAHERARALRLPAPNPVIAAIDAHHPSLPVPVLSDDDLSLLSAMGDLPADKAAVLRANYAADLDHELRNRGLR